MSPCRYSAQEKEALRKAVQQYAEVNGFDQENLEWLFATRTTGRRNKLDGPWQVISRALPHRTMKSVWACGTRMLHPNNYKVSLCLSTSARALHSETL